ncbi:hypothetical protein AUP44_18550 [Tistrella mobilis]|uniref:NACHT domain-containing protein n=1 Tax=Tistrella mobilis TaxID=171437 RepID=A0A162JHT5_9PROT|nr:hypothetical protein AUP44_18550 [Tistrella mobilis]
MKDSLLGASASGAGDDFHHRWVAREVLQLLDPDSRVAGITVEGLPGDAVHQGLGEHGQAVDVTLRLTDGSFRYLQLKYSASDPKQAWSWARLLRPQNSRKPESSVLGKLAGLVTAGDLQGCFSIVTNQPLAEEVAREVEALRGEGWIEAAVETRRQELCQKLTLDARQLRRFLNAWDLTGFGEVSRLHLQTEVIARLATTIDGDARADADYFRQKIIELMLPEGRNTSEITREAVLSWLGLGTEADLFPAPAQITPPQNLIHRPVARKLGEKLTAPAERPLRIHADGGCGKTSLVTALNGVLPAGSEVFVYDCYGGGLFLASDTGRHRPEQAFIQIGNEMAARLRTPFVIRRQTISAEPFKVFHRRVTAASQVLADRDPAALLVLVFDAVDNARKAAKHWTDVCFLDALQAASGWPGNVRVVVTCRTARLDEVGPAWRYEDFLIKHFDEAETRSFVALRQPAWPVAVADRLFDLTGGNPRRLAYAVDGLGQDGAGQAVERLLPREPGLDPLFRKRIREAGIRFADERLVWRVLGALARLPRPVPGEILAAVTGLTAQDIQDIATDTGGLTDHAGGWSFIDEDFEHVVETETAADGPALLSAAADLIQARAGQDAWAARALGQVLVGADRLDALYDLVRGDPAFPDDMSDGTKAYVKTQRLALAIRACRARDDIDQATLLLIAQAEGLHRQRLLNELILGNLDLACRFERETAERLVLSVSDYRPRRAQLHIELAAALAETDQAAARRHYRWWEAYLNDHRDRPESVRIDVSMLAAEHRFNRSMSGHEMALRRLRRWRPLAALTSVFRILAEQDAGRRPQGLLEVMDGKRWPPVILAPLMTAALLAGIGFDDPILRGTLRRLAGASRARWSSQSGNRLRNQPLLDTDEAVLFLCERAVIDPGLHDTVRTILDKAFPRPDVDDEEALSEVRAKAVHYARMLALREVLDDRPVDIKTWLIPENEVPCSGLAREQQHDQDDEPALEQSLRAHRNTALTSLMRPWGGAHATMSLLTREADTDAAWATFASAMRAGYPFETTLHRDAVCVLLRAHVLHQCLGGTDVTTLFDGMWTLLESWQVSLTDVQIDLVRSLTLTPQGHDAAAALLSILETSLPEALGSAKHLSDAQADCARAALPFDPRLAQGFFVKAITSTEKVDIEAAAQLAAASAVCRAGLGGTRTDRLRLALRLGDAAGATTVALDRDWFPWADVITGIAAADLGAGLAAAARWHDLGEVAYETTIPALLTSRAGEALGLTRRYALACLAGDDCPTLARIAGGTPVPESIFARELLDALISGDPAQAMRTFEQIGSLPGAAASPSWLAAQEWYEQMRSWDLSRESGAASTPSDPPADPRLMTAEAVRAALAEPAIDCDRLAARVGGRHLRVGFLEAAVASAAPRGDLWIALPRIIKGWWDYTPVANWARENLIPHLLDALPALLAWPGQNPQGIENLLQATDLPPEAQAKGLLDAIARNADLLEAEDLFTLIGVLAARVRPETRNGLAGDLVTRVAGRAGREPRVVLSDQDVPEDPTLCLARLIFAAMGDMDGRVRWRAAHAALILIEDGDPVVAPLIAQLAVETEPVFSSRDFYVHAAREQLLWTLWRGAQTAPAVIAPHVPEILAHLRGTRHLTVREAGRRLLLGLGACGHIGLGDADRRWLDDLNRSALPHRPGQGGAAGDRLHNGKTRAFSFDTTDTIPHWYRGPAAFFGLEMDAFLDRVEAWIDGRWGYGGAGHHGREARTKRLNSASLGASSHSQGVRPLLEPLSRYLEWHGMMCALGELIGTRPLVADTGMYGDFDDWRDGHLPTIGPFWLSDLRTPPPMEPRFWGMLPDGAVAADRVSGNDMWPHSVHDAVLTRELCAADGGRVVAGDFSLRWQVHQQRVSIRSALVAHDRAADVAQLMLQADSHMDFIVPGVGDHPGKPFSERFTGWLRYDDSDVRGDEHDEARGDISGIAAAPCHPALPLFHDPRAAAFVDTGGRPLMWLAQWPSTGWSGGSGWRLTAGTEALDRLVQTSGTTLLTCVEIRRTYGSDDHRTKPRPTYWGVWLYEADGGLRYVGQSCTRRSP